MNAVTAHSMTLHGRPTALDYAVLSGQRDAAIKLLEAGATNTWRPGGSEEEEAAASSTDHKDDSVSGTGLPADRPSRHRSTAEEGSSERVAHSNGAAAVEDAGSSPHVEHRGANRGASMPGKLDSQEGSIEGSIEGKKIAPPYHSPISANFDIGVHRAASPCVSVG